MRKSNKIVQKKIAKDSKSNPKSFWKFTQSKLKTKTGIPDLEVESDEGISYTTNDTDKANVLQTFFSSVFTEELPGDMPYFEKREFSEKLENLNITPDIVLKKLKKLKVNKSPGPDKIHPRVLHEIAESICIPVSIIFNTSLRLNKLPNEWKIANVTAIYKKGNKSHAGNYRPVSLTSVLCKVLENLLRDEVIKHMKENNLFSDKQFGFISGRSTMLQLLKVLDIWTQILDQGGEIDIIYCDFMKAFDKVPHKRLLYKIKQYGIDGNILGWIEDFLSDRTQSVIINSCTSKAANVTSGIPQGSVLGPILFVLYINDLPSVVDKDTYIFLFADDTKAFRQIHSPEDNQILQKDIDNMIKWSNTWLLKFHPQKCTMMHMGKTSPPKPNSDPNLITQHTYHMEGHPLSYSQCEKDLGVHIDNALNFDKHINQAINKATRVMAIVRKTFDYMDKEIFLNIYKGLIRPHLEYASSVWSPHLIKHIEAIEGVQRRATKQIPGFYNLEYGERLKKLKLPTLKYRRLRGDMIQTFKILHDEYGYDKSLPPFLKIATTSNLRGNSKKLFVDRCNKDIRKFNFSNRIVKYWNSLPETIINSKDVWDFEKKLDAFWSGQPLMYEDFKADII